MFKFNIRDSIFQMVLGCLAAQKDEILARESLSLSELIKQQGVAPVDKLDELSDLWPVDDDPDLLLQYVLQDRMERRRIHAQEEPIE